ncbi:YeiH family protein [Aliikangiella sp. IMCC44653]
MQINSNFSLFSLITLSLIVFFGYVGFAGAMLLGVAFALVFGNPFQLKTQWLSTHLMKWSIVTLGLSLNLSQVAEHAVNSFGLTVASIVFALVLGFALGKAFKVEPKLAFLITGGTAICGASAIAATAPAINAKAQDVIISISIVFILNAVGLIAYPELGHWLGISQVEFGLWAALGIHDTSSVVGAAAAFGDQSLEVATTTKLTRALWIIPLVVLASFVFKTERRRSQFPIFILFFIVASLIATLVPFVFEQAPYTSLVAKKGMALSLFLIGTGFTRHTFTAIRWSALALGSTLWVAVSIFAYFIIV